MADTKRVRVYYEGDDDRVVLEGFRHLRLLPDSWEIAKRDKQQSGKDGLVAELVVFVRPVNGVAGDAVVLVDLDDNSADQLCDWFHLRLRDQTKNSDPAITIAVSRPDARRVSAFTLTANAHSGRAILVPVGCCEDIDLCQRYSVDRFAIDDHILRLVSDERVYSAVSEFDEVPHAVAIKKLTEVGNVFRANGIAIKQTKRFMHILRAVAAVRPSNAAVIDRLMKKAGEVLTSRNSAESGIRYSTTSGKLSDSWPRSPRSDRPHRDLDPLPGGVQISQQSVDRVAVHLTADQGGHFGLVQSEQRGRLHLR